MTTMAIPLPCGRAALIDEIDHQLVSAMRWRSKPARQAAEKFYVWAWRDDQYVYLHRLILNPPPGLTVDHVNGDGLDNRRINIRVATVGQNNANRTYESSSGFRGVESKGLKFRARIARPESPHGMKLLGYFATAKEAARAYDREAIRRFGECARLNFPAEHQVRAA